MDPKIAVNPSWTEDDWNRHKLARLIEAVKETLEASERFEDVSVEYALHCWTITAIPRLKIPEHEPTGEKDEHDMRGQY